MMRHLLGTSGLVFSLVLGLSSFTGCMPDAKTKIATQPVVGGGSPNDNSVSDAKPLPDMAASDLRIHAMEELMRMQRSSGYLLHPPPAGHDFQSGCVIFDTNAMPSRYLRANYRCVWEVTDPSGKGLLRWQLSNNEDFKTLPDGRSESAAALNIVVSRPTASASGMNAPVALRTTYARTVDVTIATGAVIADSATGDKTDTKTASWAAHLEGFWDASTDPLHPSLNSHAEMEFTYRPAASTNKLSSTLSLVAQSPIAFVAAHDNANCYRPKGQFTWTSRSADTIIGTGVLNVDEKGLSDSSGTQSNLTWPAGACLEF